jgi:FdrA protein
MVKRLIVRQNRYFDSVFLMQVAHQLAGQPGIKDAFAVMGTDANRKILAELGYGAGALAAELAAAAPNDLVFALEGEEAAVQAAASDPDRWLSRGPKDAATVGGAAAREPRSLEESLALRPDASVAVISLPGHYAAREARAAIARGLNIFLFSSNVPVEDELALKREAREKGLIVMGPDCGTAYIGGAGIGFANAVRRGPIGIVGSTGTGMQEFTSLVHQAGSGISHGIGTGSRDLSDAIGGISTMTAIDALERDPGTKVIALLSKPSGAEATARLMQRLAAIGKPVVVCVLGARSAAAASGAPAPAPGGRARFAATIDEAVIAALEAVGVQSPVSLREDSASMHKAAAAEAARMNPSQRFVRGVFAGGTFCYQSQAILSEAGLFLHSNSPLPGMQELDDPRKSLEHSMVDMGAEIFVEGRPHPMIDATLRRERVASEGRDTAVALLLLDFILGAISSRNPVGDLLDAIGDAKTGATRRGAHLCVVASVCGTRDDAQDLEAQSRMLQDAGVLVFPSNAQAARFTREVALLIGGRKDKGR